LKGSTVTLSLLGFTKGMHSTGSRPAYHLRWDVLGR
jgi:hypothetical protein